MVKKRIAKKNTVYSVYRNTKWFKTYRISQKLMAVERMIQKYAGLKKKFEAELKRINK